MLSNDMRLRRERAMKKVWDAIEEHGGTTLLSTGITGDDARLALAAVKAGARLLEPNHPAVALARGLYGVTTMNDAEAIRHRVPMAEMVRVIEGVRNVVGPEIFITAGVPGGFTEVDPTPLREEDVYALARAGVDGLHVHKSSLADLKEVVELAHRYGLTVDAYITHPGEVHHFGVPAATPAEVAEVAKEMEAMGVDMIGLMTGMSYAGVAADEMAPPIRERLEALVKAVKVPTLAEGGINLNNFKAFKATGVKILVVGTSFDDLARQAVAGAVSTYLEN